MKRQKSIDALTETAKGITFPAYDAERVRFGAQLRELIGVNFGHSAGNEADYDDDSRTYYWQTHEIVGQIGGSLVEIRRTFSIDPSKPLTAEFQRVTDEYGVFRETRNTMCRALIKAGGKL